MNSFFKSVLATVVGLIIFGLIVLISGMISIAGMIATADTGNSLRDNSVLVLNLSGTIKEQASENILGQLTGNTVNAIGLNDILSAIRKAKENEKIKGIYIEAGYLDASYATLQEIRNALADFKASKKWIVSYADIYTQGAYYVSSLADEVLINPQGMLDWHGLGAQPMFIKDAAEKFGIRYQVIKVGKYKSATEMFTEEGMSPANREQVSAFINGTWQIVCRSVADSRKIKVDSLNAYADRLISLEEAADLKRYRLVDRLVYADEIKSLINARLEQERDKTINQLGIADMRNVSSDEEKGTDEIAVYYAQGDIVQNAAMGLFNQGDNIVAQTMCKDLEDLMNNDDVKAVVIRINSGGGDAYASEQIWHQVALLKAKKPVVVSMGDYAASGAYYLSCNANWIVAQPTTLTGSIGIFGVIPDFSNLVTQKLGVKFDEIKTNKNSTFGNLYARPLNQEETFYLTQKIHRGYALFRQRVADGRKLSVDAVERIAQGHVWLGKDAKNIKLVDQLGGLDVAIKKAAELARTTDYYTYDYPAPASWIDMFVQQTNRSNYIDEQLRATLGVYYEPLMMARRISSRHAVQAQIPFVLNMK